MKLIEIPSTLTPAQVKLIEAISHGATISAAAVAADVHRATFYKWLNSIYDFQEAVQEARYQRNLALDDELSDMGRMALSTVREFIGDPAIPKHLRLRAALAFLARPRVPGKQWSVPTMPAIDCEMLDPPATQATLPATPVANHSERLTPVK